MLQSLQDPGIKTRSRFLRGDINLAVQIRRNANYEFTGQRLSRFLPALSAKRQIVVNRFPKGLLDLIDGYSLEGDYIAKPDHLAVEDVRLVVKFYLFRLRH